MVCLLGKGQQRDLKVVTCGDVVAGVLVASTTRLTTSETICWRKGSLKREPTAFLSKSRPAPETNDHRNLASVILKSWFEFPMTHRSLERESLLSW